MKPKYLKCPISSGFAIVSEKEKPLENYFPILSFYDSKGNFILTVPTSSMAFFYQAISASRYGDSEHIPPDHVYGEFVAELKGYKLILVHGCLFIVSSQSNGEVIAGIPDGMIVDIGVGSSTRELLKAIDTLA